MFLKLSDVADRKFFFFKVPGTGKRRNRSLKAVIHFTARGSFPWLLPQQFQGDKPGTWYIAILHGVNSRRQFCCTMHRGRVLVCPAAPWPVIENIYVVLQSCWYWKNITKKRGTRRSGLNSGLCEVKVALQQFVRNWLLIKLYTKDNKNYIRMPE